MRLQHTLELTLPLDSEKFSQLLNKVYSKSAYSDGNKIVDDSLNSKGIIVIWHDKQYKKKVQFTVNLNLLLDGGEPDQGNADILVRKLEKHISSYFSSVYQLDDFDLTKIYLTTDIDVRSREYVTAYIQVLQRIGKVKGFSPPRDNWLGDGIGFCLDGNSNGIDFMIYDLEGLLIERAKESDSNGKKLKAQAKDAVGLLRADVRLMKSQTIRAYSDKFVTSDQITDLCGRGQMIFLDTFKRIVPFGDFYKKEKAVEIICKEVTDMKIRRRMLSIVTLISSKKSILLAQKALNYRRVDEVMEEFRDIEVSPVTISKRHNVKKLDNLYKFM